MLDSLMQKQHQVPIGDANGVDKAVQQYLASKNKKMSEEADVGFMIWNKLSEGSLNNMVNMLVQKKNVCLFLHHENQVVILNNSNKGCWKPTAFKIYITLFISSLTILVKGFLLTVVIKPRLIKLFKYFRKVLTDFTPSIYLNNSSSVNGFCLAKI